MLLFHMLLEAEEFKRAASQHIWLMCLLVCSCVCLCAFILLFHMLLGAEEFNRAADQHTCAHVYLRALMLF
jgi:hypothetical protein